MDDPKSTGRKAAASPDRQRATAARFPPLPPSITAPFDALTVPDDAEALPVEHVPSSGAPRPRPLLDLFPPQAPEIVPGAGAAAPAAAHVRGHNEPAGIRTPFGLSTDPRCFFHSTPHDRAAQQLLTAMRRREGLVLLTGASGSGKTTLCRFVLEQLDRRTLTSFVSDSSLSADVLLHQTLSDFGVLSRDDLSRSPFATRRQMTTALQSFVDSLATLDASAVVIVDEAHHLPAEVFDEIRTLCEAAEASSLLQVVLVGEPGLLARLHRPENASLQKRVTARAELAPLPADEIGDYVRHRLTVAGVDPAVEFDGHALDRVFMVSNGNPRIVNVVCERALARADDAGVSVVTAAMVDAARAELQLAGPRSRAARLALRITAAAALVALVIAGAAAAAWVFRASVGRALVDWQQRPSVPAAPPPRVANPLTRPAPPP